jgi:hypothetical protein
MDPRDLRDDRAVIPGLKPPVTEFCPTDDGDPSEVDAFNRMIRELRNQNSAGRNGSRWRRKVGKRYFGSSLRRPCRGSFSAARPQPGSIGSGEKGKFEKGAAEKNWLERDPF